MSVTPRKVAVASADHAVQLGDAKPSETVGLGGTALTPRIPGQAHRTVKRLGPSGDGVDPGFSGAQHRA